MSRLDELQSQQDEWWSCVESSEGLSALDGCSHLQLTRCENFEYRWLKAEDQIKRTREDFTVVRCENTTMCQGELCDAWNSWIDKNGGEGQGLHFDWVHGSECDSIPLPEAPIGMQLGVVILFFVCVASVKKLLL